jgi:hypothetical protein
MAFSATSPSANHVTIIFRNKILSHSTSTEELLLVEASNSSSSRGKIFRGITRNSLQATCTSYLYKSIANKWWGGHVCHFSLYWEIPVLPSKTHWQNFRALKSKLLLSWVWSCTILYQQAWGRRQALVTVWAFLRSKTWNVTPVWGEVLKAGILFWNLDSVILIVHQLLCLSVFFDSTCN